jgi:hypothetical protein
VQVLLAISEPKNFRPLTSPALPQRLPQSNGRVYPHLLFNCSDGRPLVRLSLPSSPNLVDNWDCLQDFLCSESKSSGIFLSSGIFPCYQTKVRQVWKAAFALQYADVWNWNAPVTAWKGDNQWSHFKTDIHAPAEQLIGQRAWLKKFIVLAETRFVPWTTLQSPTQNMQACVGRVAHRYTGRSGARLSGNPQGFRLFGGRYAAGLTVDRVAPRGPLHGRGRSSSRVFATPSPPLAMPAAPIASAIDSDSLWKPAWMLPTKQPNNVRP